MSPAQPISGQAISALVVRNANVALLAKVLQQQKVAGQAMVAMIDNTAEPAAAPPPQGAPEPGKGQQVDVTA